MLSYPLRRPHPLIPSLLLVTSLVLMSIAMWTPPAAGLTTDEPEAQPSPFPCQSEPQSAQFDFWLGAWDVYVGEQLRGDSHIEALPGGCLIMESYTVVGGSYAGKSMNFYDPALGKWRQIWVDNGGNIIRYEGGLKDSAMVLNGILSSRDGKEALSRMTFTPQPDGTVRQLMEQSDDGGKTWSVVFDGRYVKKASSTQ